MELIESCVHYNKPVPFTDIQQVFAHDTDMDFRIVLIHKNGDITNWMYTNKEERDNEIANISLLIQM